MGQHRDELVFSLVSFGQLGPAGAQGCVGASALDPGEHPVGHLQDESDLVGPPVAHSRGADGDQARPLVVHQNGNDDDPAYAGGAVPLRVHARVGVRVANDDGLARAGGAQELLSEVVARPVVAAGDDEPLPLPGSTHGEVRFSRLVPVVQLHADEMNEADIQVGAESLAGGTDDLLGIVEHGQRLGQIVQKGGVVFAPLALGDVVGKAGDRAAARAADPREVNVEPAAQGVDVLFKPNRLAAQCHAPDTLNHAFVDGGHHLADALTHEGGRHPAHFLVRLVRFENDVVNRFVVAVEQHLDGGDAFFH